MKTKIKTIHWVYLFILILTLLVSVIGLFSTSNGVPFEYVNQYGDTVKIHGDGLYANDSFFKAPILRASDATMLFVVVPLYIFFFVSNIVKQDKLSRYILMSCVSILLYYSASLAFGVIYNSLHLVYIALFAVTLFTLIYLLSQEKKNYSEITLPYKTIYTFLIISGTGLIVAWLPDILSALFNGTSLALIENHTTEITYVLDMGIIAPVCFITVRLLQKRAALGYELLVMLLFVCTIVGIMVCLQTVFQTAAGIVLPVAAIITKVAIFAALAVFSITLLFIVLKRMLA